MTTATMEINLAVSQDINRIPSDLAILLLAILYILLIYIYYIIIYYYILLYNKYMYYSAIAY